MSLRFLHSFLSRSTQDLRIQIYSDFFSSDHFIKLPFLECLHILFIETVCVIHRWTWRWTKCFKSPGGLKRATWSSLGCTPRFPKLLPWPCCNNRKSPADFLQIRPAWSKFKPPSISFLHFLSPCKCLIVKPLIIQLMETVIQSLSFVFWTCLRWCFPALIESSWHS